MAPFGSLSPNTVTRWISRESQVWITRKSILGGDLFSTTSNREKPWEMLYFNLTKVQADTWFVHGVQCQLYPPPKGISRKDVALAEEGPLIS